MPSPHTYLLLGDAYMDIQEVILHLVVMFLLEYVNHGYTSKAKTDFFRFFFKIGTCALHATSSLCSMFVLQIFVQ